MNYLYTISYDETLDDFYGIVDLTVNGKYYPVFTIDTTKEMCDYLKTDVMRHIDDVVGLKSFLEAQNILKKDDTLTLIETVLY